MSSLYYPSASTCPSVKTIFVEGYKFDICEVGQCHYDMLLPDKFKKPSGRFFVAVDDNFIVGFKFVEDLHEKGVENRWEMFCTSLSDAKYKIEQFEKLLFDFNRINALVEKHPNRKSMYQPKIESIRKSILERYNIKFKI